MNKKVENIFSLKNKIILVTGAAGLLGRYHTEAILKFEGKIILIDKNQKRLQTLESKLQEKYPKKIKSYCIDITDEKKIAENVKLIKEEYGRLDGLVNNAASNPKMNKTEKNLDDRLENFNLEKWNFDLSVSLTGAFLCTKHYGKLISQTSAAGSIVNIASDLGIIAPDQRIYPKKKNIRSVKPVSYSVSKFGIIGLTKYTSTYWCNDNVRCNVMCPGGVKDKQPEKLVKNISNLIPLGRMALPNEYQGSLVWLLSDASSYLNGAVIPIDGGRTAW